MKLPNGERAHIPPSKLEGYCLDPAHKYGRHKAHTFASVLGITRENVAILRAAVLDAAKNAEVVSQCRTERGMRYQVDFELQTSAGQATVTSGWIIRESEGIPHLVTCYIRERRKIKKPKT